MSPTGLERCPNCRARLGPEEHCRRCGLELALLRQTRAATEAALARALALLASGDREGAQQELRQARSLDRDPLAQWLLGLLKRGS